MIARRVLPVCAALFTFVVGCTSDVQPDLPPNTDTAAIADRVTGPDGQAFLRELITTAWDDDGHRAADLFTWIPRDAPSTNPLVAELAGNSAHAIGSYLADKRESFTSAPANPALWQAFAQTLAPYLGAMVGDDNDIRGFEPLDGINSPMPHTISMIAAMAKDADASRTLTEAASARAHTYEAAFAKAALAEPLLADRGTARTDLLRAARLRGLVAAASTLAGQPSERATVGRAQTELAYQVVSLTARPGTPSIGQRFFRGDQLLSPGEINDADWSIYDTQLTVYLATSPRINDAIRDFGDAYNKVAKG